MKYILLILFFLFHSPSMALKLNEYAPINITKFDKDLSLFKIENSKISLTEVKNGGSRGANQIVMYDEDTFSQTNEWGYEAQINENFEVVSFDINVKMLENGYIISGHSEGAKKIKENINIGDYVIFIKEINTAYIFEPKDEYKNAFYFFKINYYLKALNEKMIKDNLYEEIYSKIYEINNEYKNFVENNKNIVNIYSQIKELYNQYFNKKEKIDISKLSFSNSIKLDKFEYLEKFTGKNNVKSQNFVYNLSVSHEGGFRKEDELVKYDETNIIDRNQYGFEIAVNSNNNVINSGITVELPENGYILSGHGKSKDLLSEQIKLGDYLVYKDMTVSIYRDTNINICNGIGNQIEKLIEKYNKLINDKIPLHYEEIAKRINMLISYYNSINKEEISFDIESYFYLKEFDYESLFLETKFLFIETNPVQIQAMWHTPNSLSNKFDESSKEGVQKFLKLVQNQVLIEYI